MNDLAGVLPAHLQQQPTAAEGPAKKSMGKDDFMKLLLAQLQHQDPLNPMDHKDMSAQLAQFSSLEQLANIGSGIQNLKSGMGEDQKLQATGLIGRKVALTGNELELQEGQVTAVNLDRSTGYEPVKITVHNAEGKVIREIPIVQRDATSVSWDGKMDDGGVAAPGKYAYRVIGVDGNGQAKELNGESSGKVVGVELNGKDPLLVVDSGASKTRVALSKVKAITLDDSTSVPRLSVPTGPGGVAVTPQGIPSGIPVTDARVAKVDPESAQTGETRNAESFREFPRPFQSIPGMERP